MLLPFFSAVAAFAAAHGTLDAIRTRGLSLRSSTKTMFVIHRKSLKTVDIAGYFACHVICYSPYFPVIFGYFSWFQLAGD